jgi:hypothetical protein
MDVAYQFAEPRIELLYSILLIIDAFMIGLAAPLSGAAHAGRCTWCSVAPRAARGLNYTPPATAIHILACPAPVHLHLHTQTRCHSVGAADTPGTRWRRQPVGPAPALARRQSTATSSGGTSVQQERRRPRSAARNGCQAIQLRSPLSCSNGPTRPPAAAAAQARVRYPAESPRAASKAAQRTGSLPAGGPLDSWPRAWLVRRLGARCCLLQLRERPAA